MVDVAISAKYETLEPGARIELYNGALGLSWAANTFVGTGSIHFEWQPYPRVGFNVSVSLPLDVGDVGDQVRVELLDTGGSAEGRPWRITDTFNDGDELQRTVEGSIAEELLVGNPAATDSVIFHVPNFPDYVGTPVQATQAGGNTRAARLTATTAQWIVELDAVPHAGDLAAALTKRRGFGITHVGRIRRLDGAAVPYADVEAMCSQLYWWLSLLRSERTGPILVMGVHEGVTVWETWQSPTVSPWRGRWSWLPRFPIEVDGHPVSVSGGDTLRCLSDSWANPDYQRAITRAIDWYTQSVSSGYAATTVILAQAGLELMSWLRLVRDMGISEDGFSKLSAADSLRLALSVAEINTDVPAAAPQLFAAAEPGQGLQRLDGPASITEIRNGAVHPKPLQRFADPMAAIQGGLLAIQFLELMLLHRLGYTGSAYDRITWEEPEPVPWAPATVVQG